MLVALRIPAFMLQNRSRSYCSTQKLGTKKLWFGNLLWKTKSYLRNLCHVRFAKKFVFNFHLLTHFIPELKVVAATFLQVCFFSKSEHSWNKENCFLFHFESSFCFWDNQILTFQILKCHDVKCLSMKHETHIIE